MIKMYALNNKKGAIYNVALVFFILIAFVSLAAIMLNNQGKLKGEETIGFRQAEILRTASRAETAQLYIDKSASLAVDLAIHDLAYNGGFFLEPECKSYMGRRLWNTREKECYPSDTNAELEKYIKEKLAGFFVIYKEEALPADYVLNIIKKKAQPASQPEITIKGVSSSPMFLTKTSASFGAGDPFDLNDLGNKYKTCTDGKCIAGLAEEYYKAYGSLPYVWGGESPYTYELTIAAQKDSTNNIFDGVSVTKYQPGGNAGRSGALTVPGFDCSGFVWWTLSHAEILRPRLTAAGYYDYARNNNWHVVCKENECDKKTIKKQAQPGDIMFIDPCKERGICHIGIYIGDNKIIESIGGTGITKRDIPQNYYSGGAKEIRAIYRPVFSQTTKEEAASAKTNEDLQKQEAGLPQSGEVFDAPSVGSSFSYSIFPGFSISRNYDIDVYKTLGNNARWLIEKVLECENEERSHEPLQNILSFSSQEQSRKILSKCIDMALGSHPELNIGQGCEPNPHYELYDVFSSGIVSCSDNADIRQFKTQGANILQNAHDSQNTGHIQGLPEVENSNSRQNNENIQNAQEQDNYCACEITPVFDELFSDIRLQLLIEQKDSDIVIKTDAAGLFSAQEYTIKNKNLYFADSSKEKISYEKKEKIEFDILFDKKSLKSFNAGGKSADKGLYVVAKEDELIFFLKSGFEKSSYTECETEPGRAFVFCYQNPADEKLAKSDSNGYSYDLVNPAYRFALSFVDSIAPPRINTFYVSDFMPAAGKILLYFQRPLFNNKEIEDLSHYNIYCSKNEFNNAEQMTPSKKAISKDSMPYINLSLCSGEEIIDDNTYYIAVTAVDYSGNEIKENLVSKAATPRDNLAPAKAVILSSGINDENMISLSWDKVTKNFDNTQVNDLAGHHIYYGSALIGSTDKESTQESGLISAGTTKDNFNNAMLMVFGADEKGNTIPAVTGSFNITYQQALEKIYPGANII